MVSQYNPLNLISWITVSLILFSFKDIQTKDLWNYTQPTISINSSNEILLTRVFSIIEIINDRSYFITTDYGNSRGYLSTFALNYSPY